MRVVLDTCILYSALRSSSGASHRVLSALPAGKYRPVLSTPLMFEYEEVLLRPRQFPHLRKQEIDDFLDYIASVGDPCRVNFLWRPCLSDPGDDLVLEAAVSGQAEAIVTYNLSDFAGAEQFGIRLVLPADLSKELKL
jgi:putative PIN family toxin of toxin-antitoxin system